MCMERLVQTGHLECSINGSHIYAAKFREERQERAGYLSDLVMGPGEAEANSEVAKTRARGPSALKFGDGDHIQALAAFGNGC